MAVKMPPKVQGSGGIRGAAAPAPVSSEVSLPPAGVDGVLGLIKPPKGHKSGGGHLLGLIVDPNGKPARGGHFFGLVVPEGKKDPTKPIFGLIVDPKNPTQRMVLQGRLVDSTGNDLPPGSHLEGQVVPPNNNLAPTARVIDPGSSGGNTRW